MTSLCGKGVWLAYSYDLPRAVELTTQIGGTHLLVKVGHGAFYFPESARELYRRTLAMNLEPLAWIEMTTGSDEGSLRIIEKALTLGYQAVVLMLDDARLAAEAIQPLVETVLGQEEIETRLLLASSPPAYLMDDGAFKQLARICHGGWMPLCFPSLEADPERLVNQGIYQALGDLALLWGEAPAIYPVLTAMNPATGESLDTETMLRWADTVTQHGLDFFSIFHAASTEKAHWDLFRALSLPCLEAAVPDKLSPDEPPEIWHGVPSIARPVYITVAPGDSVISIITRYGMTREQFWQWNAHLWESRGFPRDPDYLQAGWRVRVR